MVAFPYQLTTGGQTTFERYEQQATLALESGDPS